MDISISISSIVRVNYLDGHFLSVFIAQVAEMRALKKEVHRQMQIHGDYKVGASEEEDIEVELSTFRAGTTERILPST